MFIDGPAVEPEFDPAPEDPAPESSAGEHADNKTKRQGIARERMPRIVESGFDRNGRGWLASLAALGSLLSAPTLLRNRGPRSGGDTNRYCGERSLKR